MTTTSMLNVLMLGINKSQMQIQRFVKIEKSPKS